MAARIGGQQIATLLESLPGIASVLRSPVADAIVGMIRAGTGLGEFHEAEAQELVQYAVRRGLLGSQEGEQLLAEVRGAAKELKRMKRTAKARAKKATAKPAAKTTTKVKSAKSAKKSATKKVVPKAATKKVKAIKAATKRATAKRRKG